MPPADIRPGTALLALDFGGTKLSAADCGADGYLRRVLTTPTAGDAAGSLAAMLGLVEQLTRRARPWRACGVSFGGHVDRGSGTVRRSLHVPGWSDVPLAARLEEAIGCPVAIANDGSCGALGEWHHSGRSARSLLYLTISTGVGGGIVLDGRLYEGAGGMAGEFGHLQRFGNRRCVCGARGCLETVIAGPAIAREYRRLQPRSTMGLDAAAVSSAAAAGDAIAAGVLSRAGSAAGRAVADLVCAFDPQIVAVGGGVARSGAPFWSALHAQVAARHPDARAEVRAASTGYAPLVGAAQLARSS